MMKEAAMPLDRYPRRAALLAILAAIAAVLTFGVFAPARARADDAREQARADLKRFLSQRQLAAGMVADCKALLEVLCDKEVDVPRALALCKRVAGDRPTRIHDALVLAKSSDLRGEPLAAAVDAKIDEQPPAR